jgi:hypothetical protein
MKRLLLLATLLWPLGVLADFWPQDYETALRELRPLAEAGDAEAQYKLGVMYASGEGVPKDYREAARWYRKAAEQGHADAQTILGNLYQYGRGVPQDYREAVRWIRMAAEQGDAGGQLQLAYAYAAGEGVPEDDREAARWFRMAAEQGVATAQSHLGYAYARGEGVVQDNTEAVKWAEMAGAQAPFYREDLAAPGVHVAYDWDETVEWYCEADEQRDTSTPPNPEELSGAPSQQCRSDYWVSEERFFTHEGQIPAGCLGALITELNGDDIVAAIFVTRTTLRGCIAANNPYPGGEAESISYDIAAALGDGTFNLQVCESVDGSMGSHCSKIVVKFVNREYVLPGGGSTTVLSLEKLGEWSPRADGHRDLVKTVQRYLAALGYEPGAIDGLLGGRTTAAVKAAQRDLGVPATGQITEELRALLAIKAAP